VTNPLAIFNDSRTGAIILVLLPGPLHARRNGSRKAAFGSLGAGEAGLNCADEESRP